MMFLSLRHSTTKVSTVQDPFGTEETYKVHCGPYGGYADLTEHDLDCKHHAMRHVKGHQMCFTKGHPRHWCYGFTSWDQFIAYWGEDEMMEAWWEAGNFVIFEYDIPETAILTDDTQAVAPIHEFEPVTAYNFPVRTIDPDTVVW